MKKLNLNQHIYVKLYDEAFEIWKQYDDSYLPAQYQKPVQWYKMEINDFGYVKFQVHSFIEIFHVFLQPHIFKIPFDLNVLIDEKELEECPLVNLELDLQQ